MWRGGQGGGLGERRRVVLVSGGLTLYLVCRRPLLGGMVTMAGRITWGHSQRTRESVSSPSHCRVAFPNQESNASLSSQR